MSKEELLRFYRHEKIEKLLPMPLPAAGEHMVYPVNGFHERPPFSEPGRDWFGCNWVKMEGNASPAPDCIDLVLEDICDWREKVVFPDLDEWDWDKAIELDAIEQVDRDNAVLNVVLLHGLWERMHVLMGFENAFCALLEDPEECEAFFDAMVDFKIKLIEKVAQYYHPDIVCYHDDWGMQTGPFFQIDLWRSMIKNRTKKVVDVAHEHGMLFMLHSCGKYDAFMPEIPEIGIDVLQCMDINDISKALEVIDGRMSLLVSVHTQDFNALEQMGQLTEEHVRETVRRDFLEWGRSGYYEPNLFMAATWFQEVIIDEYMKCREAIQIA